MPRRTVHVGTTNTATLANVTLPAEGFGGAGSPADLTIALLEAATIDDVARVAARYAEHGLGCRRAKLVWTLGPSSEGRIERHTLPGETLTPFENELFDRAVATRATAIGELPGTDHVDAATPLGGPSATSQAVFLSVCPHGLRAQETRQVLWNVFVELLRARVGGALEVESLRLAVSRLEQAEQLQRALYAIADLASADMEMPEMLRSIHEIVGGLTYAENFFIVLYSAEHDTLRFIYFADTLDPRENDPDREIPASELENSLTLAMIRRGKSMMGPSDVVREELGVPADLSFGPDSEDWLGVPMVAGGEVRGAVVVQSYDRSVRYTEEDRALLGYVAQHILTALVRKQAHEELERRVEQRTRELADANRELTAEVHERQRSERLQAALFRIAELASATTSLTEFYAAVHAIVGELLYARNFFIALLSDDGAELDFPYSVDERDPVRPRRRLAKGLTEFVLRTDQALLADRDAIERLARAGEVLSFGARSVCWLGVPLIIAERPAGVLAVQSYSPEHTYTQRDLELLTFVSYHIANGLERKKAQESLRLAYQELEKRVDERTRELASANRELRDQIGERERVELRLKHEALHDALTGLPNRSFLLDHLSRALARFHRDPGQQFAVLFLDLDRFKVVNDSVGHLVGDELLKEASARLSHCVRAPDAVARLGGDEFAILLNDLRGLDDACHVAQRVIQALSEPMRISGKELFTSASIGIALSHERYRSAEELLRDADVAMYRAKAKGRQRFELFDERLHEEALHLLDLEGDLRRAILRREFEPHFQAIVRLSDGAVLGYEALLRWRHAERGMLLPADFLAVAEESGNVEQIDWQMFEQTFKEVPRLTRDGAYVSVNVSARHFRAPDLAEQMLDLMKACSVPPVSVRIEVTEGALLDNPEQIRETLGRLRDAGVLTALDDFGTGYSSLSYLHRFPLHCLKIDRSFVADLRPGETGGSAAVVRAIRALAGSLDMEVIAEGIETTAQRDFLVELGCELGQGFLFAHPRPIEKLIEAQAS
jgi:diguanylate cyclase (GGDEF)-like protein